MDRHSHTRISDEDVLLRFAVYRFWYNCQANGQDDHSVLCLLAPILLQLCVVRPLSMSMILRSEDAEKNNGAIKTRKI